MHAVLMLAVLMVAVPLVLCPCCWSYFSFVCATTAMTFLVCFRCAAAVKSYEKDLYQGMLKYLPDTGSLKEAVTGDITVGRTNFSKYFVIFTQVWAQESMLEWLMEVKNALTVTVTVRPQVIEADRNGSCKHQLPREECSE